VIVDNVDDDAADDGVVKVVDDGDDVVVENYCDGAADAIVADYVAAVVVAGSGVAAFVVGVVAAAVR